MLLLCVLPPGVAGAVSEVSLPPKASCIYEVHGCGVSVPGNKIASGVFVCTGSHLAVPVL